MSVRPRFRNDLTPAQRDALETALGYEADYRKAEALLAQRDAAIRIALDLGVQPTVIARYLDLTPNRIRQIRDEENS